MSLYLGTNLVSGVATPVEGARNIGQIIQSTIPLTDAGLHLLDGSLISGSGSYAGFVTYMASIVSSSPDCFCSEADWQTAITTYGVCGKFVYDSVNNTIRLPKYSDKIWSGLGTAGVKGNGMTLGLTDGTNNTGLYANVSSSPYLVQNNNGAYGDSVGTTHSGGALGNNKSLGITLDPTKSGVIADLSTITTALDGYWYIVIATSTKTEIEVDIDEIATDLNGKADVDLQNVSAGIDFVVESYRNGTEWYRLYKSGWVEQGGIIGTVSANTVVTVTFPKPFATTSYTALVNHGLTSGSGSLLYQAIGFYNLTTTTATTLVQATNTQSGVPNTTWYACGMSAQS